LEIYPAHHQTPEDILIQDWTREEVLSGLAQLSNTHRAVLELVYVNDFSNTEIAQILDCQRERSRAG
jgi:DNA-directed RNA polymerase specialized sigma24 family protein